MFETSILSIDTPNELFSESRIQANDLAKLIVKLDMSPCILLGESSGARVNSYIFSRIFV